MMKKIAYEYKNLPIPGGGYVTGFLFHPQAENLLYIRTDIGGSYLYDYQEDKWSSLTESVDMFDLSTTYPIALAVDEKKPERLFIVSGVNPGERQEIKGKFSISEDYGKTYIHKELPFQVHGNWNGRGTGFRLVKDPANENGFYFASQKEGLFYSPDLGDTWEKRMTGEETYMTLVFVSPSGKTVVAGTAGVKTGTEKMRGHSLSISEDYGKTFAPLVMPESKEIPESKWSGYVAHRYDFDGKYLYVTLTNTGARSYITDMGYSCDCGDVLGGRILRYELDEKETVTGYTDITPTCLYDEKGLYTADKETSYPFGFGGISSCKAKPGLLAASTICKDDGDMLFISFDYGESWEPALYDLVIGNLQFESSYMKPCYNGGHSLLHWLSDVKINPNDPDELWFNSGTGVFKGTNFTKKNRSYRDHCHGIEETVHLNVYGAIDGPVQVIDIVGDLGGFAFKELDKPCDNSFADAEGNRYITCINADFADDQPNILVVTPRGNWTGKTKGGLILSEDYGQNFERIPLPYGISEYLDGRFKQIECPNVNSGWVALSSDAKTIVYCVAENDDLFMKGIIVSNDLGKHFEKAAIYNAKGEDISGSDLHMKVFSDRKKASVFYGFGDDFSMYISTDKGRNFYEADTTDWIQEKMVFGLIDCANKTEIRGEAGKEGIFYVAAAAYGLWKLQIDAESRKVSAVRLTKEQESVYRMGLGILRPDGDYKAENKAIYICGVIDGIYGFFRSLDDGKTWEKINDDSQMFGDINSIDGDCRTFGRYYIATGSFGLKYGEQVCSTN